MDKRPYESGGDDWSSPRDKYQRTDTSSSKGYNNYGSSGNDRSSGYSRNESSGYSRSDSGGYSRSDSSSYSRNGSSGGGFSSRRDDRYKSEGGYSQRGSGGFGSRGRGGRPQSGGFGGQNGDNWSCSSCKFSNFATRSSCYKCRTPKEGGGGGGGGGYSNKWGSSGDSGWKKPSWGDRGSGNRSYSNDRGGSWNKSDKWDNKDENLPDWSAIIKQSEEMAAARWETLGKIVKDLYVEDPVVASMTHEELLQFREDNFDMQVNPFNKASVVPNPVRQFDQAFGPYPEILHQISRQGFTTPSPIQAQAWPILLKGFDLIGISQTGSGKTLAYLLPALLHICAQPTPRWERKGPTCLVLAPTRELAQQIEREVTKIQYDNIRCVCCYGQGDKRIQIQKLNAMAEIVIATPGRLNDFVQQGVVDLNGISYLVLDEADRMLDMGFEPQVKKIVMHIRPDRQTILTSATWPEEVRSLAKKLMKDPIHVVVGSLDLQAVDTITQYVTVCSIMEKENKLMEFLQSMKPEDKAIVFVAQKITVDDLSVKVFEAGHKVESMHGGRNQRDREYSLRQLKTGRSKVLIATDVAARGIDINDVTHVMNYDCPKDMEEYVHRVGRTGRAGRKGQSLTLVCREDGKIAGKLIEVLEKSNQEVPPELQRLKDRFCRQQDDRDQYRNNRNWGGRNGWYS